MHDLGVAHPHFAGDPGLACGAGLQIGHPDHIVIGHGIGHVFRGLGRQGKVLGGAVQIQQSFDPREIVGAIGKVLKLHHLLQAGAGHRGNRGGKLFNPRHQRLPSRHEPGRTCWPFGWRWRRGAFVGCRGESGGKSGAEGTQRRLGPLATGADRGLISLDRERQAPRCGKGAEERGGNDRALPHGQGVEIGHDQLAGGNFGGGHDLGAGGDPVAGGHLFADGQRAVGRGDQRGTIRGDKAADDGAARLHHLGCDHDIDIARCGHQGKDRCPRACRGHFDVIDRGPGALGHACDRGGLSRVAVGPRQILDPRGQHAAALPPNCEDGKLDHFRLNFAL